MWVSAGSTLSRTQGRGAAVPRSLRLAGTKWRPASATLFPRLRGPPPAERRAEAVGLDGATGDGGCWPSWTRSCSQPASWRLWSSACGTSRSGEMDRRRMARRWRGGQPHTLRLRSAVAQHALPRQHATTDARSCASLSHAVSLTGVGVAVRSACVGWPSCLCSRTFGTRAPPWHSSQGCARASRCMAAVGISCATC